MPLSGPVYDITRLYPKLGYAKPLHDCTTFCKAYCSQYKKIAESAKTFMTFRLGLISEHLAEKTERKPSQGTATILKEVLARS